MANCAFCSDTSVATIDLNTNYLLTVEQIEHRKYLSNSKYRNVDYVKCPCRDNIIITTQKNKNPVKKLSVEDRLAKLL